MERKGGGVNGEQWESENWFPFEKSTISSAPSLSNVPPHLCVVPWDCGASSCSTFDLCLPRSTSKNVNSAPKQYLSGGAIDRKLS